MAIRVTWGNQQLSLWDLIESMYVACNSRALPGT